MKNGQIGTRQVTTGDSETQNEAPSKLPLANPTTVKVPCKPRLNLQQTPEAETFPKTRQLFRRITSLGLTSCAPFYTEHL